MATKKPFIVTPLNAFGEIGPELTGGIINHTKRTLPSGTPLNYSQPKNIECKHPAKIEDKYVMEKGEFAEFRISFGKAVACAPYGVSKFVNQKQGENGPYTKTDYSISLEIPLSKEVDIGNDEKLILTDEQLKHNLEIFDIKSRTERKGWVRTKDVKTKIVNGKTSTTVNEGKNIYEDKNGKTMLEKLTEKIECTVITSDDSDNNDQYTEITYGGKNGVFLHLQDRIADFLFSRRAEMDVIKDKTREEIYNIIRIPFSYMRDTNLNFVKGSSPTLKLHVAYFPYMPARKEDPSKGLKERPEFKENFCKFFDPSEEEGVFSKEFVTGHSLVLSIDCVKLTHIHVSRDAIFPYFELTQATVINFNKKQQAVTKSENADYYKSDRTVVERMKLKKEQLKHEISSDAQSSPQKKEKEDFMKSGETLGSKEIDDLVEETEED